MTTETPAFYPESAPEAPKKSGLSDFSLAPSTNIDKFDLKGMNQADLLTLHAKVESKLVGIRLSEVNLEKETLIQFQRAKQLQEDASTTTDVPMNQRAQVQNSLANLLTSLAKMQMDLHDSESIKRWKAALVRVVKELPKEQHAKFFDLIDHAAAETNKELSE